MGLSEEIKELCQISCISIIRCSDIDCFGPRASCAKKSVLNETALSSSDPVTLSHAVL